MSKLVQRWKELLLISPLSIYSYAKQAIKTVSLNPQTFVLVTPFRHGSVFCVASYTLVNNLSNGKPGFGGGGERKPDVFARLGYRIR